VPGFVAAALVLSLAGLAAADPPRSGVRLDGLQTASPDSTFFRAEGPHEKKAGMTELGLGLGLDFAEAPLRAVGVDQEGGTSDVARVVERALVLRLGASFSPAYWVRFDIQAPFALFEQSGIPEGTSSPYAGQSVRSATAPALGDLRVGLHFRPIDTESFDLIIGGRYWAPVGSLGAYLSDGRLRGEADIAAAGRVGKVLYGCTFSISPGFFIPRDGDRIAAACAIHGQAMPYLSLGLEPAVALFRDLRDARSVTGKPLDTTTFQVEPLAAVRFNYNGFSVALAGGPGFGDAPGTAQVRGMLQLGYQIEGRPKPPPPPPSLPTDLDVDGVLNEKDACPEQAGPGNPDAKLHGCPILDADGDLVRDEDDACPSNAGARSINPKANGCPDSDNDLLPNPIDQCKTEPGPSPNGCPTYARLVKGGFQVTPPIQYADGASQLSKQAKAALEEIAATMRANPKLGHVSIALGTKGAPGTLSDKRAEQITLILRGASVASQRFEVVLADTLKSGTVEVKLVR